MNKITLFCAENAESSSRATLGTVPAFEMGQKNIIFVPKGSAAAYEEKLLLEGQTFFNTTFCDTKTFFYKFLNLELPSAFKQKLAIKQAVHNVSSRLKALSGPVTSGLVDMVTSEILRFQEAFLFPEDVLATPASGFLKNKLSDLAMIYAEYLKILGPDYLPENALASLTRGAPRLRNANIFFPNVPCAGAGLLKVLKFFAQNARSLTVGIVDAPKSGNSYIFEEDTKSKILALEQEGISITCLSAPSCLENAPEALSRLLFSVDSQPQSLPFLQIMEAQGPAEEVSSCALQIKSLLHSGTYRQDEIGILCASLSEYGPEIEKTFSDFGFDYAMSASRPLATNPFVSFVKAILKFLTRPTAENFTEVSISEFSGVGVAALSALKAHFAAKGPQNFAKFPALISALPLPVQKPCNELVEKLKTLKAFSNGPQMLKGILELFDASAQTQKLSLRLNSCGQEALSHAALSIVPRLESFLLDYQDFLSGLDLESFAELFTEWAEATPLFSATLENQKLCAVDLSTPLPPKKALFVLGANHGSLPLSSADNKILTDENLKTCGLEVLTTIKQNRLARAVAYNALLGFEEKIFISYSIFSSAGQKMLASSFVSSLAEIGGKEALAEISKTMFRGLDEKSPTQKARGFARLTGTPKAAQRELIRIKKTADKQFYDLVPSLEMVLQSHTFETNFNASPDKMALLCFPENKTKISQIETFYACPFKHFMAYGLRLQEPNNFRFRSVDAGNFLHKVAEEFLSPQNAYCSKSDLDVSAAYRQVLDKIKSTRSLEKIFLPQNSCSRQILEAEGLRFCTYLYSTQKKSDFKPKFLELRFGDKQKYTLSVRGQDFSLIGVVDRIDAFGPNSVIIDYKTSGAVTGSSEELFYGEKIQIFVYALAIKKLLALEPKGVFYFPITNNFLPKDAKRYMLRGKNVFDENFFKAFDKTLTFENPKSTIFPCEIKTSKDSRQAGIIEYREKKSNNVTQKQFEDMMLYAEKLVTSAIEQILDGTSTIRPAESACQHCPYFVLCQKSEAVDARTHAYAVDDSTFSLHKGENPDGN